MLKVCKYQTNMDKLKECTVATNFKLCNALLALMSHSSCYPCACCETAKDSLSKRSKQHTIVNLMTLFWEFLHL